MQSLEYFSTDHGRSHNLDSASPAEQLRSFSLPTLKSRSARQTFRLVHDSVAPSDKIESLFPVLPCQIALVDKLFFGPRRSAKHLREKSFLAQEPRGSRASFCLLGRKLDVSSSCLEFPEAQGIPGLSKHRLDKPDATRYHLRSLAYFSTNRRSNNLDPASPTALQFFSRPTLKKL